MASKPRNTMTPRAVTRRLQKYIGRVRARGESVDDVVACISEMTGYGRTMVYAWIAESDAKFSRDVSQRAVFAVAHALDVMAESS